jgi:tetratricopeptide (TPR) repeat protein
LIFNRHFQLFRPFTPVVLIVLLLCARPVAAVCPDLTPYYPGANPDWPALRQQLAGFMGECLDSAEYFALFGASQLNSGDVAEAIESLERALLLDPLNGAAQIDYAQALYLQGDLFAALELNDQLLAREDLPANISALLERRQRNWRAVTRQGLLQLDVLAGYDRNLNNAPDPGEITLTLSGEDVVLALNPDFRPVSGPYLNLRLGGRYRQLAPEYQHNWLVDARARVSEDSQSDQVQLDTRYAFVRPGRRRSWQLDAGMSHLFFGGSPLYTATETAARYLPASSRRCKPYYGLAVQHQLYHDNSRLNGVEGKISTGLNCPLQAGPAARKLVMELALLENAALKSNRPGGDQRELATISRSWKFPDPGQSYPAGRPGRL